MIKLTLVLLSFFFGILSIRKLRKYDVHEKEPFGKMLAVAAWGGLVSILLSFFFYRVLSDCGVSIRDGFPYSYFYVGFIEELGKLAALFLCWPIIRNEMNEPTDGPIYIACVALGFSLIENYLYAQNTLSTTPLIAIRLIICTPMHIAFSMLMGLAFFWALRCKGGWGILLCAYVSAGIHHALYDIFVSYWFLLPGLYLILKSSYHWMHRLLGYTAAQSPFRRSLAEFIHSTPATETREVLECLDCGNRAPKPTYCNGRIRIQHCEVCGTYLCSKDSLFQIIHQFGSLFGNLNKRMKRLRPQQHNLYVLEAGNRLNKKRDIACFQLDEFNGVLESMSRRHIEQTERKWWFPFRCEQQG
jgi:RsiW-degrading membrane proteinase PrsW (M82 family)